MVKAIMMKRVIMATGLIIMYDQSSEGYDGQGKIMLNVRGWLYNHQGKPVMKKAMRRQGKGHC
jgi:hypothetical protein